MTKEDFCKVWKDSTREEILNQYYYDYTELKEAITKARTYIENNGKYYYDRLEDEIVKERYRLDIQLIFQILKGEDK